MLLDTHIVIWLAFSPEKLSAAAVEAIRNANEDNLAISAASFYEMLWLIDRKRVKASSGTKQFMAQVEKRFKILPIDSAITAYAALRLNQFHADPMDRLIVATALITNLTLITADRHILASKACKLLW